MIMFDPLKSLHVDSFFFFQYKENNYFIPKVNLIFVTDMSSMH